MSFTPSRHPYTYAADQIRNAFDYAISRSEAAMIKEDLAKELGIPSVDVAKVFSWAYQDKKLGGVQTDELPFTIPQATPELIEKVLKRSGIMFDDRSAIARILSKDLTQGVPVVMAQPPEDLVFTEDQKKHLADLVLFAMVGYGLVKADRSEPEQNHPAIAAFYPLVEAEINARRERSRLEAEAKYGLENEAFSM